jgi:demethylmenaquinone methyltransferase / 2-methoxy-6-polyprenyl-1,4-benzoquinol methylase
MIPATADHTASLFDRIAPVYDRVNTVVSVGTDRFWRARVRKALPPGDRLRVLDVATGTGEIAFELLHSPRVAEVVGVDPAAQMLAVAERKAKNLPRGSDARFQQMDAIDLAFDNGSFDVVTVAFGVRNMIDPIGALRELRRVLRPGGRLLVLEFSLPGSPLVRVPFLVYFRHVLPRVGGWFSGNPAAYRYLNRSVEGFPYGEDFAHLLRAVGLQDVRYDPLSFGIATLYQGSAP